MSRFMMMIGLPGSGKSTYVNEQLAPFYEDVVVLSSDAIREEFRYAASETKMTFSIMHTRLNDALIRNKDIIYDATNLTRKFRMQVLNRVKHYYGYVCSAYIMCTPFINCLKNNDLRDRKVPDEVIRRMLRRFEIPVKGEGWNYIYDVRAFFSEKKYSMSRFYDFDQDNPHHSLTLAEHCYKVEKLVSAYCLFDKEISNAMFHILHDAAYYHDIGKILTKEYKDAKGNPSETAHYYGHENVGAYMVLSDMTPLKSNQYQIAVFIAFHMKVSFSWRNNENSQKTLLEKSWFTEEELKCLEVLGKADREAH